MEIGMVISPSISSQSVVIEGERVLLREEPCSIAYREHLLPLTKTQLLICLQLLQHYAQPTPYEDLGSQSVEIASPSLQQQISRLRTKLRMLGFDVYPVRNMGYILRKCPVL
jgi:DNA-binding response OmpR family regulator